MTEYARAEGAAAAEVDGETVVLSPSDLRYHSLNDTAAAIWDRLAEPATIDGLVDGLQEDFEVDRDRCESDVARCVADLTELGIVRAL